MIAFAAVDSSVDVSVVVTVVTVDSSVKVSVAVAGVAVTPMIAISGARVVGLVAIKINLGCQKVANMPEFRSSAVSDSPIQVRYKKFRWKTDLYFEHRVPH